MRLSRILFALACVGGVGLAAAAPKFPPLSGRVVDTAHLLSPQTRASLEEELASYEAGNGTQLVVATVPSLGGYEIEDYGYQLGRAWGIGQKGKNNGVLLIVAPNERRVRVEVGYGFEGQLTDAASNQVIQTVMLPQFKQGRMEQGVVDGVHAIEQVLGGDFKPVAPNQPSSGNDFSLYMFLFILVIFFLLRRRGGRAMWLLPMMFGRRGGGNDGFGGGGGSFGGGGSSGRW